MKPLKQIVQEIDELHEKAKAVLQGHLPTYEKREERFNFAAWNAWPAIKKELERLWEMEKPTHYLCAGPDGPMLIKSTDIKEIETQRRAGFNPIPYRRMEDDKSKW